MGDTTFTAPCMGCSKPATVHVVGATDAHGIIFEEFWCDGCYAEHERLERLGG